MKMINVFILFFMMGVSIFSEPITFSIFSDNVSFNVDDVEFRDQDLRLDFTVDTNDITFFSLQPPFSQATEEGFRYENVIINYSSNAAGINSQGQRQEPISFAVSQRSIINSVETQRNIASLALPTQNGFPSEFIQVEFEQNTLTNYDGISNFTTISNQENLNILNFALNDILETGEAIKVIVFSPTNTFQASLQNGNDVPEPGSLFILSIALSCLFFSKHKKKLLCKKE